MTAATLGPARRHKIRVIAPDVGGGFGGKIGVLPEEMLCARHRAEARQTGEVDRDPLGVAAGRPPRPRPDPGPGAHRQEGRHPHRLRRAPLRRPRRLQRPRRAGRADLRRVHVQRDLQDPGAEVHVHDRLHHQDAHRRLPRRRSSGGHVRDRADHGRARRRARTATRWSCASRTGSSTRSSRSPRSWASPTTRATTSRPPQQAMATFDYAGLRREQEERRASGDPVQLGIGISTFTEMCGIAPSRLLGSLAYGAGGWEAASIRMLATGKVEVVTGASAARAGARDGVQPDRRRPARRALRGRRDPARRHPGLAEGPGHLRLAVAGRRRHRHRQRGAEGGRQGQEARGAPAGGVRGRPRVRGRPLRGQGHRQGHGHPGGRVGRVHGARLPGGHGAQPRLRRRVRPGELLLPARHAPRVRRGRHRDRARATCASTSAWTTSATWSTR